MERRDFLVGGLAAAGWASFVSGATSRTPQRPLRVGMIGTTHSHAAGKLEAVRRQVDWFDLVGVVEPDADRCKSLERRRAYAGVRWLTERELLATPGLDAVLVETAIRDFVPTALRCAAAERHIHLEKPAGPSLPTFQRLLDQRRRRELVLQMGDMFRYNPSFALCFQAARDDWLGRIFEVHGVIGKVIDSQKRQAWAEFPGGAMFELGCHLLDAALIVLGKPDAVHPFMKKTRSELDRLADNTLADLEYPRATTTLRRACIDDNGQARRQLVVCVDNGPFVIRPLETHQLELTVERPP